MWHAIGNLGIDMSVPYVVVLCSYVCKAVLLISGSLEPMSNTMILNPQQAVPS